MGKWFLTKFRQWRESRAKDRRRFWRILIQPGLQFRCSEYFTFIVLLVLVMVNGLAFFFLIEVANLGKSVAPGTEAALIITKAVNHQMWPLIAGGVVFVVACIVFGIRMSHNISGPAYALGKHIDAILSGDYDHRTYLRKDDELKPLRDKLNRLSERLKDGGFIQPTD
jgi:methyl-accepting chemotaxis protein